MASIVIVGGPNEGDYYPVGKRTLVVGRDPACPIQVIDDLVSRKHLQIRFYPDAGSYRVLDMKSSNGVSINGRRIDAETDLVDGDIITIGNSRIMFTARDFEDRESAMNHFHRSSERARSTMVRPE